MSGVGSVMVNWFVIIRVCLLFIERTELNTTEDRSDLV